jgi:hypothetical protein
LFQGASLSAVLKDRRVTLIAGAHAIRASILSTWQPALMGDLHAVPLRPWCERERAFFEAARVEVERAVDAVRDDFSVQAHFGKRWFSNIILNMAAAERSVAPPAVSKAAHVTAAGPSLDNQLEKLRAARAGGTLIASDTSLPALLRAGIRPDSVLSIDCQNHSYNHFLQGIPAETSLVLDLASPPFLALTAPHVSFVAGGHPFVRFLDSHWKRFQSIDTSGGNVTHAAVSLASLLGAATITLYGADFSYPAGKPYCRGTYLYDLFDARQGRCAPTESRMYSFLFRTPDVSRERTREGLRYATPVLLGYRERLRELMRASPSEVIPMEGAGLSLSVEKETRPARDVRTPSEPQVSVRHVGWRDFLGEYAGEIEALGELSSNAGPSFTALPSARKKLWATLFPIAAQVVRESSKGISGEHSVNEARRWALARLRRVL